MNRVEKAAEVLLKDVMERHDLKSIEELQCPNMFDLALALKAAQAKEENDPNDFYSKEAIKERLETQDNRCTADPFFIVREEKIDLGYDTDWDDGTIALFHRDDPEYVIMPGDEEHAEAMLDEDYEHTGFVKRQETVAYFFTEGAANAYIENNRHRHDGVLSTYADSLYRKPEMIFVRDMLMKDEPEKVEEKDSFGTPVKWETNTITVEELGPEWNTISDECRERLEQIDNNIARSYYMSQFIYWR